jgi:hypothetical protein
MKRIKKKTMKQKANLENGVQSNPQRITISGVVFLEGTERGINGLSTEIFHIGKSAVRLASGITNSAGRFNFMIEDDLLKRLEIEELNIKLVILRSEKPKLTRAKRILFESEIRTNTALQETFLVELSKELLESMELHNAVKSTRPLTERRVGALDDNVETTELFSKASTKFTVAKIKKAEKERRFFDEIVKPKVQKELTNISENDRLNPYFVEKDEDIIKQSRKAQHDELVKLKEIVENSSGNKVSKVRRQTRIQLSSEVLKLLGKEAHRSKIGTISQEELEKALGTSLDKPAIVQFTNLAADQCRSKLPGETILDTGEIIDDEGGSAIFEASDEESNIAGRNVVFDAGKSIAALMDLQSSPEHTVQFNDKVTQLEGRLEAENIAKAIGGITLKPGPADVPSFHDFSSMQIAFQSVWQEAIDDRILKDVEVAYDRIVESGLGVSDGSLDLNLIYYLYSAFVSTIKEVPVAIASHVRISLEEFRALPSDIRAQLDIVANDILERRAELITALDLEPDASGGNSNGSGGIMGKVLNTIIEAASLPVNLVTSLIMGEGLGRSGYNSTAIALLEQIRILNSEADRIVSHARQILIDRERNQQFRPSHEIINRLRNARSHAYPFKYFAASRTQRSVNFGVMITYRQKWIPVSYQVGDLVSTLPLGPKQSIKISKKEKKKQRRLEKELETNLSNSKFSSETKSRAEAEIFAKATGKTSFTNTSTGTFSFGPEEAMGAEGSSTSSFTANAERHSQNTKKNMRESVVKAAEERKRETKMEVETEETFESEFTESSELMNPNDEIPVTFLLYELQRRYRINEKLHRLQSVVLVAQEMPKASEIDSVWIILHDWILNRVLLDDSFKPALVYVSTTLVSERETLSHMKMALLDQQTLVEQITEDLADRRSAVGLRYAALEKQIERMARNSEGGGSIWNSVTDAVSGGGLLGGLLGGGEEGEDNAATIRENAARDAWERERQEAESYRNRLVDAQSTLATMRSEFHERLSKHLGEVTQVERLATHIYQNIMHYMQAIWSHEPNDQRFLRLRNVPVPNFERKLFHHVFDFGSIRPELNTDNIVGTLVGEDTVPLPPPPPESIPTSPLAEVADLSNPLGFMGNYMILPMYESNVITDFMMNPYVEFAAGEYRISDPDPAGNMSLDEFSDYVVCLKKELPDDEFNRLAPGLTDRLKILLQRSIRENEEIIVGTGNLYIECLPGAHSIMEQFKHLHRQIDVKTAQEDLRAKAIDNVRRAKRILIENLEDPDIEAKYVFEGGGSATVVPPTPPNS